MILYLCSEEYYNLPSIVQMERQITDIHTASNRWNQMEHLYEMYYRPMYAYALAMMESEVEAEDAVASVMQTVWEDWMSDHPRLSNPTKGMLMTAVRNRCLDMLRHSKVEDRYISMLRATEGMDDDEGVEEFEDRIRRVEVAVEQLPESARRVLECTYYKKMTYRETAQSLGISEAAVKKQMMRTYRLLREMLKMLVLWYLLPW